MVADRRYKGLKRALDSHLGVGAAVAEIVVEDGVGAAEADPVGMQIVIAVGDVAAGDVEGEIWRELPRHADPEPHLGVIEDVAVQLAVVGAGAVVAMEIAEILVEMVGAVDDLGAGVKRDAVADLVLELRARGDGREHPMIGELPAKAGDAHDWEVGAQIDLEAELWPSGGGE